MVDVSTATLVTRLARSKLDAPTTPTMIIAFVALLAAGILFTIYNLYSDLQNAQVEPTTWLPFLLLAVALLIAYGFHDTANAVATVIYTNALPPLPAVVWSGLWNFLGVPFSTGVVAFGIISLLPVELILQVGSGAGFAMVFALLIAAIIWNLGTWYLGLPASSSHTLIGSIIGVGLANQLIGSSGATSGVDWAQAEKVGEALLFSPLIGFICSALLFLTLKAIVRSPQLYKEPKGDTPPPMWIRAILVLTCTGVSFAHGSNDGQKGMGLIMLILIGIVPTAYALNRAVNESDVATFVATAHEAEQLLRSQSGNAAQPEDPRAAVSRYLRTREPDQETLPALATLTGDIARQAKEYGSIKAVPAQAVQNVRNDMYLAAEAIRLLLKKEENGFPCGSGPIVAARGRVWTSYRLHRCTGVGRSRASK